MVKWTIPAKDDLKMIYDFIKRDSIFYAKKVISDIFLKTKQLNEFPKSGRIIPELMNDNIGEIIIYSYRIFYRIKNENIEILAVIHGKMNFDEKYLNRQ